MPRVFGRERNFCARHPVEWRNVINEKVDTVMTIESGGTSTSETADLRRAADLLCLWRLCGKASCRRYRTCRGRAHVCAKRNSVLLPASVREFFAAFLAAKRAGLSFDQFRADMEQREETKAFFAWRRAAATLT